MKRVALMLGTIVLGILCVAYGAISSRAQGLMEGSLRAEIAALPSDLFTVLVLPPGLGVDRMVIPKGLTAAQADELASRLSGVAELATVGDPRRSSTVTEIKPDGSRAVVKPPNFYLTVSANYFDLLELVPAEGRFFTAAEERSGTSVCVVGADCPERLGTEHSDPRGDMRASYLVVGRMPTLWDNLFPVPRSMTNCFWASELHGETPKYIGNRLILTPATSPPPLPEGPFDTSAWRIPLVAPYPGFSEEARAIVRDYLEELWPGATLDFGLSGWMVMALEQAAGRVRSYSSSAFNLMLALCAAGTAGFMALSMAGKRRTTAVERSLGKPRLLILLEAAAQGGGLALTGALAGAVVGAWLLGGYLLEWLASAGPWPVLKRLALIAGLTTSSGLIAGLWTAFWATNAPPIRGLRQASIVPSRRAVDFRVPLAVLTVALGTSVLVCLLVSSRSSVAALGGYLQSVGERVILVEQDIFRAEGPLHRDDFLGPRETAFLRESFPDWDMVGVSVTPAVIQHPDGRIQPATGFGLDEGWPPAAGYQTAGGGEMDFASDRPLPVVYLGHRLARNLFGDGPAVGEEVILGYGSTRAVVGGVLKPRPEGVPDRLGDRDESFFVRTDVLQRITSLTPPQAKSEIWVYLPMGYDKELGRAEVAAATDAIGGKERGLTAEPLVDQVSRLSHLEREMAGQQLALAALALAATAWLVGLVMLARLADRRRELGLRRAVGAPPWRVGLSVAGESLLICLSGGALGSVLGLHLAARYCLSSGWPIVSTTRTPLEALAVVALLGLLAAFPSLREATGGGPLRALREGDL